MGQEEQANHPAKARAGVRALLHEDANSHKALVMLLRFFCSILRRRVLLGCMCRFAESFRSLHSKKLQAAEDKSVAMFVSGDMPAVRGKRKLKPMTEVCTCVYVGGRSTESKVKRGRVSDVCGVALRKAGGQGY